MLAAADHTLAASFSGAVDPLKCNTRHFCITIIKAGAESQYRKSFRSAIDALQDALTFANDPCAKIDIRPEIEFTFAEGKARWPQDLHATATMEAFKGWLTAQAENMPGQPQFTVVVGGRSVCDAVLGKATGSAA